MVDDYNTYLKGLLSGTMGLPANYQNLIDYEELKRKRELADALNALYEGSAGTGSLLSGARIAKAGDIMGRSLETGQALRSQTIADIMRENESRKLSAAQTLAGLGESATQRAWQGGENVAERALREKLQSGQQTFEAGESSLERKLRESMQKAQFGQEATLQTGQQTFQAGESALDRALRETLQTGQQKWQTGERLGGEKADLLKIQEQARLQTLENEAQRKWQSGERLSAEEATALQNKLNREQQTSLQLGEQKFQAGESALDRALRETMQGKEFTQEETMWGKQEELAKYLADQEAKQQKQQGLVGLGGQVLGNLGDITSTVGKGYDWLSGLLPGAGGVAGTTGTGLATDLLGTGTGTAFGLPNSLSLIGGTGGTAGAGAGTGAGAGAGLGTLGTLGLAGAGTYLAGKYLLSPLMTSLFGASDKEQKEREAQFAQMAEMEKFRLTDPVGYAKWEKDLGEKQKQELELLKLTNPEEYEKRVTLQNTMKGMGMGGLLRKIGVGV